ncbi:MAG: methyltransferase domain-containing protein [Deltaproteobacteria bacterium]
MSHDPHSRKRLHKPSKVAFTGEHLFDRVARAVCDAECLPRKELYESWEVARRARRRFKGGRVVDLACGHGVVAHLMVLLDKGGGSGAVAVDRKLPPCAFAVQASLVEAFPQLANRVELLQGDVEDVTLTADDVVVAAHACGGLTDRVLAAAIAARARVAVLPCCHSFGKQDQGGLAGWLEPSLAIDVVRAARLRDAGYDVHTQTIPDTITPKNRLLFGRPRS